MRAGPGGSEIPQELLSLQRDKLFRFFTIRFA